jgi:hypothetical protein
VFESLAACQKEKPVVIETTGFSLLFNGLRAFSMQFFYASRGLYPQNQALLSVGFTQFLRHRAVRQRTKQLYYPFAASCKCLVSASSIAHAHVEQFPRPPPQSMFVRYGG